MATDLNRSSPQNCNLQIHIDNVTCVMFSNVFKELGVVVACYVFIIIIIIFVFLIAGGTSVPRALNTH